MADNKEKRKLLIATDSFLPRWDGIARFLNEMLPFLSEKYDVTVLAPHFPGRTFKIDNAKVLRFPVRELEIAGYHPAKIDKQRIKQIVRENDLVFSQTIGPIGANCLKFAHKFKKPTIAFIHSIEWELFSQSIKRFGWIIKMYAKFIAQMLYNRCRLLIVPSITTARFLDKKGIRTKKAIVHLGTDANKCSPAKDKALAKKKIGLDPKKTVIGYAGRFGREKDLPTLIRAFNRLSSEFDNIQLLLVGGKLENDVSVNVLNDKIKIVGPTNRIVKYYQAMDIYVLPSHTETTSLTTVEAMSCGVAVIATSVGFINEYLKNKENGYLFKPGSVERLIVLLRKLITDKRLRETLGRNARATIIRKFSWKKTAKDIIKVLDKVNNKNVPSNMLTYPRPKGRGITARRILARFWN